MDLETILSLGKIVGSAGGGLAAAIFLLALLKGNIRLERELKAERAERAKDGQAAERWIADKNERLKEKDEAIVAWRNVATELTQSLERTTTLNEMVAKAQAADRR
jgi:cell wall assembly regulator SMI1